MKTYLATATIMTMIPWVLLMIAEIPGNHRRPRMGNLRTVRKRETMVRD